MTLVSCLRLSLRLRLHQVGLVVRLLRLVRLVRLVPRLQLLHLHLLRQRRRVVLPAPVGEGGPAVVLPPLPPVSQWTASTPLSSVRVVPSPGTP